MPGVPSDETKAIFESAIRTLVQLHTLDTDRLHVDDVGDKENYIKHRVRAFVRVHYAHVVVYNIVSLYKKKKKNSSQTKQLFRHKKYFEKEANSVYSRIKKKKKRERRI